MNFDRVGTSLKNLTVNVYEPINGLAALERIKTYFNHIIEYYRYHNRTTNRGPIFQLEQLNLNVGPDDSDIWESVGSEHILEIIELYCSPICGPNLNITSWIGCTPVVIPARQLAITFNRLFKKLQHITIDETVIAPGSTAAEYVLTLATHCPDLRGEVTMRPPISADRKFPPSQSGVQVQHEEIILHFQVGRDKQKGMVPYIESCTREIETTKDRALRSP
jgi:hypothetical protein